MQRRVTYGIVAAGVVAAGALAAVLVLLRGGPLSADTVLAAYAGEAAVGGSAITYPLDGTLFPPEIPAPTFEWRDEESGADTWLVCAEFRDDGDPLTALVRAPRWTPTEEEWEAAKRRSLETDATVTVVGVHHESPKTVRSAARTTIRTSEDEVGAPLLYREVILPFIEAVKDPSLIRWRFGDISSKAPPPVVLEGLPTCGNCHSFSADGRVFGMDVDYANDKGSYAIAQVSTDIVLDDEKIITWSDYRRDEGEPTFGLLAQISPDGCWVISTVKDRSVFVPKPGLEFSQLFFPLKGILAVYRRDAGTYSSLPGADDPQFVQSNPVWSPDGEYITFARSGAYPLQVARGKVLLSTYECREFLYEGKTFLFDLYQIPFNDGRGGRAEPLEGASQNGASNYFPKYSPDGKWIVFCKAESFMLLQPDSELYIVPAEGGEARRMRCNTGRMNSWHSWSPNGRWLVFSSKSKGPYTQLFLTHVDPEGNDTPPVELSRLTSPLRAANIPEFVNAEPDAIVAIREQFLDEKSFLRMGMNSVEWGDYAHGEEAYRRALELNPESVDGHNGLGVALINQGRTEEAIEHYAEALRLDPNRAKSHCNMAGALVVQGKPEEAIAHYAEALRLQPDYLEAHTGLGVVLAMQGRFEEAIEHHRTAISLDPKFASLHYNLALAFAMQGELDEAVAEYKEAIRLDPKDAKARSELGVVLEKQGKPYEAMAQYSEALKINAGPRQDGQPESPGMTRDPQ